MVIALVKEIICLVDIIRELSDLVQNSNDF